MKKKEKKKNNPILIFCAFFILFLPVFMRIFCDKTFYNLETSVFTAQNLTQDVPNVPLLLWTYFKQLFSIYFKDYLLPVYVFLLPAIFLLSWGLSGKEDKDIFSFLKDNKKEKIFLAGLFVISFFSLVIMHFLVIGHPAPVGDEFCYMFQADLLASGKLYADSPPMREHFHTWSIINDGKWYSKVTIGWPLLLAMGRAFHLEFLVNPFCGALSLLVLYLLGKKLLDHTGAVLSVFFAVLSPLFFLLAGTYFPHNATVFLSLIVTFSILKAIDEKKWVYAITGGIACGFLPHIRPGDGLVIMLGNLPLLIYLIIISKEKKSALLKGLAVILFFFIGIATIFLVNKIQNGDPMLFGYVKYDPDEKWGFGVVGHTPLKGLWNTVFSFMRNGFWTVPFICVLTIMSFFRRDLKIIFMLFPIVLFSISYFGFYSMGAFEIGSRYYLPSFIISLVPAAGGLLWLRDRWEKMKYPPGYMLIPSAMVMIALFMIFGVFTTLFPQVRVEYAKRAGLGAWLADPPQAEGKSIIFLKNHADKANMFFTRNYWNYDKAKNIIVFYLRPSENKKFIELFPDRKVYTIEYNNQQGTFNVIPGVDNSETAENYILAGYNYMEFNKTRSIEAFSYSLTLMPDNPSIIHFLALLYVDQKQYDKAIPIIRSLMAYPQYKESAMLLEGTTLGSMGRKAEAIEILEELIKITSDKGTAVTAQNWIDTYRKGQ